LLGVPRNRIAELRREQGLSQKQLGAEINVHESTISRWEAGLTTIPDPTKQQIAEFFSVNVAFLMGWDRPNDNDNDNDGQRVAAA
jgi:transcriptional regulator with XRE-family HTH domain